MAEPEGFAATFVSLYRQVHDELRKEVSGLNKSAMSWLPGPDTNSLSTLVVHLLGSETEVLQIVRGLPANRDRASEFSTRVEDPQELLSRIDTTDPGGLCETRPDLTRQVSTERRQHLQAAPNMEARP